MMNYFFLLSLFEKCIFAFSKAAGKAYYFVATHTETLFDVSSGPVLA